MFLLMVYWRTDTEMTSLTLLLDYIKQLDSMLPCLCSATSVTSYVIYYWTDHGNMESIC